ncbi:hypothetical protein D9M73_97380 [compost metagenome]
MFTPNPTSAMKRVHKGGNGTRKSILRVIEAGVVTITLAASTVLPSANTKRTPAPNGSIRVTRRLS